jgi:hypothetical protein
MQAPMERQVGRGEVTPVFPTAVMISKSELHKVFAALDDLNRKLEATQKEADAFKRTSIAQAAKTAATLETLGKNVKGNAIANSNPEDMDELYTFTINNRNLQSSEFTAETPSPDDLAQMEYDWEYRDGYMFTDRNQMQYFNNILDAVELGCITLNPISHPDIQSILQNFRNTCTPVRSSNGKLVFTNADQLRRLKMTGIRPLKTYTPTSTQAAIPVHQVSGGLGQGRVRFNLPSDFEPYDPADYGDGEHAHTLLPATPAERTLKRTFTGQTVLPTRTFPARPVPTKTLDTDELPDIELLQGAKTSQRTSQRTSQGIDDNFQELVKRLKVAFPNMTANEPRGVDASVKESLLETLYDTPSTGPTMFVQAPAVKLYSGEHRSGDMDELVWFGQIANLARNTRQTLLQCLISHTSGTALKWVTLKAKRNAQAQTQLRNITKGTIIDTEGDLTDQKGNPILKFSLLSDTELAEAFGKHFLTYRQDDVETAKLSLEQNQCVQKEGQNLENFIVQFQTLLMEAEIDTSTMKDQFNLVVHFYNGLLPGLKKHGYTNYATLNIYNNLNTYWNFLRRHVQKDEARKLVNEDMK